MFQRLDGAQDAQDDRLRRLVSTVVDITLHHVLWTFQQEEELTITVKTGESSEDLRESSIDGLEGELYDWIDKYSEYPRTD
jgi:hypothetical protein